MSCCGFERACSSESDVLRLGMQDEAWLQQPPPPRAARRQASNRYPIAPITIGTTAQFCDISASSMTVSFANKHSGPDTSVPAGYFSLLGDTLRRTNRASTSNHPPGSVTESAGMSS